MRHVQSALHARQRLVYRVCAQHFVQFFRRNIFYFDRYIRTRFFQFGERIGGCEQGVLETIFIAQRRDNGMQAINIELPIISGQALIRAFLIGFGVEAFFSGS